MEEIVLCMGSSCYTRGNNETIECIKEFLKTYDLEEKVDFRGELCTCNCKSGPNLRIGNIVYNNIDSASTLAIMKDLFKVKK